MGERPRLLWASGAEDTASATAPFPADPGRRARIQADPDRVERGLVQLVLTLVELIRQLMERQAVRRMEAGSLTARQEEDLGTALMRLELKMQELKDHFQLQDEDLNLSLGPLGDLL
jgi:hypothetical protein